MRNRSLALALVAALMCACASIPPQAPTLPEPDDLPTSTHGSWVMATSRSGAVQSGELFAVAGDSVVWIQSSAGRPACVSVDTLKSVHLVSFDPNSDAVGGLTVLGTLSTISNGAVLIFTAPLWIITGTAATASRAHEPQREWPRRGLDELAPYARFPAGMPAGFLANGQVVEGAPAPVPTPTPPAEQVVAVQPPPPKLRHFALHGAIGPGYHENSGSGADHAGIGFITGVDANIAGALFLGVRFSMSPRDVSAEYAGSEWGGSGESFDLGFLAGVAGHVKRVHAGFGVGPAAYGADIGEVFDFNFSIAMQGDLMVDVSRSVAAGIVASYNQNDRRDFYVVGLGVRFMVW